MGGVNQISYLLGTPVWSIIDEFLESLYFELVFLRAGTDTGVTSGRCRAIVQPADMCRNVLLKTFQNTMRHILKCRVSSNYPLILATEHSCDWSGKPHWKRRRVYLGIKNGPRAATAVSNTFDHTLTTRPIQKHRKKWPRKLLPRRLVMAKTLTNNLLMNIKMHKNL